MMPLHFEACNHNAWFGNPPQPVMASNDDRKKAAQFGFACVCRHWYGWISPVRSGFVFVFLVALLVVSLVALLLLMRKRGRHSSNSFSSSLHRYNSF
jgi:hypothetical protein